MAELERTVLEFYGTQTPYPIQWPSERNDSDGSDDENEKKAKLNRRKSRYQALERAVSQRSSYIPGSEKSANGVENLVQKDEADPLGTADSVVRSLKLLGVPLQDDPRLRNRFLLSSTTFSPALFLSQMHATANTEQLVEGLSVLSQSIDQKSASLKVLVESNFERFVRAKEIIDNVYKEMKYRGAEPPSAASRVRTHSRHASRNSFRGSGGGAALALGSPLAGASDARKKNALVKESEYGVLGIKAPLLDVSAKAEDVWGPALGGREKEESLKTVTSELDRFKEYVETSATLADCIKRKDYEGVVDEYNKARQFADAARQLAQGMKNTAPKDEDLYQMLVAARMWHDVEEQIQGLKRDVWKKLISTHSVSWPSNNNTALGPSQDQYLELISLLLELGVEDNPIWMWLLSRYDHLKSKIQSTAERAKVEIEILRRRLANAEKPSPQITAGYLRTLGRQAAVTKNTSIDSADIVELWEKMLAFMNTMMSSEGILGEVVEFWHTVQGFVDGKTQKNLPVGYNGESRQYHRLSQQGTVDLQRGTVELVDMIREHVFIFYAGPPPEDISLLFSPLPSSPATPMSASLSGNLTPTGLREARFPIDLNNFPPSPKRGEQWEKFAFWPPWSNSVSAVQYLAKMLALVGSGASDMAGIAPVGRGDAVEADKLKTLVSTARERCVAVLCIAWNKDAENIKYVEDWCQSSERRDVTRMPATFAAFESALLSGMQKILYVSEAMSKPGAGDIVLPPPPKLLQAVRAQYVNTLYKALGGMVENAERSVKKADDDWTTDVDGYVASGLDGGRASLMGDAMANAGDRNVRMLLTLSNLLLLRAEIVPNLNTQFENAFSVKLTDESKTIRDVLGQIDDRLFQSYVRPSIETLRTIIRAGVTAPDWASSSDGKPREVRPYVYEALLSLVLVHSQVSSTTMGGSTTPGASANNSASSSSSSTSASLTSAVLSHLLEQTSRELLDAFRTRPRYDLGALMQATLDVEFVAQTLSHYTSDRASELQSQIYQELDGRTDNDARARLQAELPQMRTVLKRLREASKSEFACFRKPKRGGAGSGGASGGAAGGGGGGGVSPKRQGPDRRDAVNVGGEGLI